MHKSVCILSRGDCRETRADRKVGSEQMKNIQYKLTHEEEELLKMATANNKNKHLLDHKNIYMNAVRDAIKGMLKA